MSTAHHNHNHHHHHGHHSTSGKRLGFVIFLNITITVAQSVGGLFSGSLSLLSDALHNASDVLAMFISYIANRLVSRQATPQKTFGYKRAEILAALINAVMLIAIGFNLIYQAILRLSGQREIEAIDSGIVMGLALLGVLVNGGSILALYRDSRHNLNMRSAYLHLAGDVLTSVAVFVGGLMMYFYQVYWLDSLLTIFIAIYLVYASWQILKSSLAIVMQFAPSHLDLGEIEAEILLNPEIANVHHVHLWQISDRDIHFEGHLTFKENISLSKISSTLGQIQQQLKNKFSIHHITLQPEYEPNCDANLIKNPD
ncbi:cation diffusion facilitator family transporter [Spirulina sp. 06S082]|uniref:cation diffusion facilitator family transporter n=1 Tax=Spirulina sp. 06S082 TaxID=3110248 RepID=UPI002B1EC648|nr:cation diffusion facilitator family transporter [Spirulina sp. 06S082]MEA5470701.1 cation diffusion facilitator family transporter [Spirulina sp. 06S082]